MESARHGQQAVTQEIEEEPCQQNPKKTLAERNKSHDTFSLVERWLDELCQAGGADDPIFMLRDAFAAEESPAFRATRDSFTRRMIKASLILEDLAH